MKEKFDQLLQILQNLDPTTTPILAAIWSRLKDSSRPSQWLQK